MDIEQIIAKIKAGPNDITLYSAATKQLIENFEAKFDLMLPPDFKQFYSFSNGFESAEDMFRLIPLEELMDDWRAKGMNKGQFYFCEYLIYCDMWGVNFGVNKQSGYSIFYPASDDRRLFMTDSLVEFLDCFLKAGVYGKDGLYDWSNSGLTILKSDTGASLA
jgi:hypothetical protein